MSVENVMSIPISPPGNPLKIIYYLFYIPTYPGEHSGFYAVRSSSPWRPSALHLAPLRMKPPHRFDSPASENSLVEQPILLPFLAPIPIFCFSSLFMWPVGHASSSSKANSPIVSAASTNKAPPSDVIHAEIPPTSSRRRFTKAAFYRCIEFLFLRIPYIFCHELLLEWEAMVRYSLPVHQLWSSVTSSSGVKGSRWFG